MCKSEVYERCPVINNNYDRNRQEIEMSKKAYFPLFVDIRSYRILVVGGGQIALRRIRTLLQFEPDITVIAQEVCEEITRMEEEGKLTILRKKYESNDLCLQSKINLVLAATNNKDVNHLVWEACKKRNILVNVADDRSLCDFYFPSIVMNEDVVIGINSGGKNPSVVKKIRRKIEELLEKTRKIYE